MSLIDIIPDGGLVINASDLVEYVIPDTGMFTATPLPVPFLTTDTTSDIGTTTAIIGCTTDLKVDTSDILYFYTSTSATPPSTTDLIAGTSSAAYGNDVTVTQGVNTFPVIGLVTNTTYYNHFYQTTSNGNSLIFTSSSFTTDDIAVVETQAPILNSVSSPESTIIRANVTTPDDNDHQTCLFYYKLAGSVTWIAGGQGLTVQDTTDTYDIISLEEGKSYEVMVIARDTSYKQSLPSQVFTATTGGSVDELELLMSNLKTLVSKSATFQTITGAANESAAEAFIFKEWLDSADITYPHAIISEENVDMEMIDTENFLTGSTMSVIITDEASASYETRDSDAVLSTFRTNMGKIARELSQLQGVGGNLRIEKIGYAQKPAFGMRDDSVELVQVEFYIETGF